MVNKLENIDIADRRIKYLEIIDAVNLSIEGAENMCEEKLDMKKVSARWVPIPINHERTKKEPTDYFGAVFRRVQT